MKSFDFSVEEGSALLEFVVLGLLGQVVVLGLAIPALNNQRQQLAATNLAAQISRGVATQRFDSSSFTDVEEQTRANYDLPDDVEITISMTPESPHSGQVFEVTASIGSVAAHEKRRMPR
jgi:hypothetical protein